MVDCGRVLCFSSFFVFPFFFHSTGFPQVSPHIPHNLSFCSQNCPSTTWSSFQFFARSTGDSARPGLLFWPAHIASFGHSGPEVFSWAFSLGLAGTVKKPVNFLLPQTQGKHSVVSDPVNPFWRLCRLSLSSVSKLKIPVDRLSIRDILRIFLCPSCRTHISAMMFLRVACVLVLRRAVEF